MWPFSRASQRGDVVIQPGLLRPADVLLYKASGLYGRLISIRTGSRIGHVEVSTGGPFSVASRDGHGVDRYALRTDGLLFVLRPTIPFDLEAAMTFYDVNLKGQSYGWGDLLGMVIPGEWDTRGIVCSPFATLFLRAGGLRVFDGMSANKITPRDFLLVPELLQDVTAQVSAVPAAAVPVAVVSVPAA